MMGTTGARSPGLTRSISYTGARSTTTFSCRGLRRRSPERLRERLHRQQGRGQGPWKDGGKLGKARWAIDCAIGCRKQRLWRQSKAPVSEAAAHLRRRSRLRDRLRRLSRLRLRWRRFSRLRDRLRRLRSRERERLRSSSLPLTAAGTGAPPSAGDGSAPSALAPASSPPAGGAGSAAASPP